MAFAFTLCSGGTRRQPELSLLQPVAEGHSALNALPADSAGPGPTPDSQALGGSAAAQGASRLGRPSSAAAQPAEQPAAAAPGQQNLARSDSGSGLPLLLLSPPISMPPSSLLPLPPLSVTSGGTAVVGAPLSAGRAAAADEEAERLLQLHFRPSSSKLTEMFKLIEEQHAAGASGSPPQQQQQAERARSPRTAAELRAALLRLAQQSPPQLAQHTQHTGAIAGLLPPHLGLPLAAGGLWPPAAAAAMLQHEQFGLSLLDFEVLEALARPTSAQHRWEHADQEQGCRQPGLGCFLAACMHAKRLLRRHAFFCLARRMATYQQPLSWAVQPQAAFLPVLQAESCAADVGSACLGSVGPFHCRLCAAGVFCAARHRQGCVLPRLLGWAQQQRGWASCVRGL